MPMKIGGKYIAEGSYGCVFGEPPLKCEDDDKRLGNNYISKLMYDNDLNEEMNLAKWWKEIDPDNKFTITPYHACDLDLDDIKIEDQIQKCTLNKQNNDLLKYGQLLFYKNGGPDLHHLHIKAKNYKDLFIGFQNIWDGLVIAHNKGLYHLDIKPTNILKGAGDEVHLRLIDFGLSVKSDFVFKYDEIITLNSSYYQFWPFEFGCFDPIGDLKSRTHIKNRFDTWNKRHASDGITSGVTQYIFPFEQMYSALKSSENIFKKPNKLFEKADVYGLGITLMHMVRVYFSHSILINNEGENHIFFNDKKTGLMSRFSTLKDKKWLSEKETEYQMYLYENVTKPLVKFINKCVHYDLNIRYTTKEAANEYKKLLPIFEKHLKTNDIKKYYTPLGILNKATESPIIPTPVVKSPASNSKKFSFKNIKWRNNIKKKFTLKNIISKRKMEKKDSTKKNNKNMNET